MKSKILSLIFLAWPLWAQSITITTPADAATVTGTITTAVTVASLPALCSVEWQLNSDASILPARDQTQNNIVRVYPWTYQIKSVIFPDGVYTISAIARDCLGAQIATDTNTFTIDNNPLTITLTSPADPAANVTASTTFSTSSTGSTNMNWYLFVDGRLIHQDLDGGSTYSRSIDPSLYTNGVHLLQIVGIDKATGSPVADQIAVQYTWRANFATSAGTAMELRTASRNVTLVAGGATYAITGFIANTDGTTSAATISCVSDLPSIASVSGCVVTPVASGLATITVTDSGTSKTALVYAFVRTSTSTPHFGKDGSIRTTYDPSLSHGYIRSMFGFSKLYIDANSTLITEGNKSGLNTLEENFYNSKPGETGISESAWHTAQDATTTGLTNTINSLHSRFRFLLIGDGMARGGTAIGDAIGGPAQQTWTSKPVAYAALWAKTNGKTLGIDMVDEVNTTWGGQPRPNFKMGVGMTKVVVTGGTAVATLSRTCGAGPVANRIIGGVTSGLNTTSVSATCSSTTTKTWTTSAADGEYNFSGTGCGVSPCVAEPNLEILLFYNTPVFTTSPTTPPIVETAFTDLVGLMTASSTRPKIGWPLQGTATGPTYASWNDSSISDFTSMLISCALECGSLHPYGSSLAQSKANREGKWLTVFPNVPTERPNIIQTGWAGQSFHRGGLPAAITSISGNVVTSASSNAASGGKARIQGASDNAHNNWFYVGKVFSPTSYEIFNKAAITSLGDCTSGTITGEGSSWSRTFTLMNNNGIGGASSAYPPLRVGEHVTVSGCAIGGYNREWIFLALNNSTSLQFRDYPTASSTGGTIRISVGSDFDPAYDAPLSVGTNLKDAFGAIAIANLLPGLSGTRSYSFDVGAAADRALAFPSVLAKRSDNSLTNIVVSGGTATVNFAEPHRIVGLNYILIRGVTTAGGTTLNVLPVVSCNFNASATSCTFATGATDGTYTDSTITTYSFSSTYEQQTFSQPTSGNGRAAWRAQANAWNLFQRIEPFMLQPILPSPDYGWCLMTAARGPSTYGRALLVLNVCEVPITQTIDYSAYVYSGKPISEYRADWTGIRTRVASGTSAEYTIQPGELIALLFHDASSAYVLPSTFTTCPTCQPGASKVALRYAYAYNEGLDLVTASVSCTAGVCSPGWDPRLGDIWYWYEYLNGSDVVQARSDRMRIPQLP